MSDPQETKAPEYEADTDDQSWFWTAEWQAEENEATPEIERGELSKPLHSVEEIRQHLSEF